MSQYVKLVKLTAISAQYTRQISTCITRNGQLIPKPKPSYKSAAEVGEHLKNQSRSGINKRSREERHLESVEIAERISKLLAKQGGLDVSAFLDNQAGHRTKEKSHKESSYESALNAEKYLTENKYFLENSSKKQPQRFENIHDILKKWKPELQPSHSHIKQRLAAQTRYNPDEPKLWMRLNNFRSNNFALKNMHGSSYNDNRYRVPKMWPDERLVWERRNVHKNISENKYSLLEASKKNWVDQGKIETAQENIQVSGTPKKDKQNQGIRTKQGNSISPETLDNLTPPTLWNKVIHAYGTGLYSTLSELWKKAG